MSIDEKQADLHILRIDVNTTRADKIKKKNGDANNMKATGIVRRIDDLGRVVIPKEIRRTMRIREGDPSQMTLSRWERFCLAVEELDRRAVSDDT